MPTLALFPHLHRGFPGGLGDPLSEHGHGFLVHGVPVHLFAQDPLDPLEQLDVVLRDERDGFPRSTGTGRSTDPMDVLFRVRGDVVVDDQVDERDIETSTTEKKGGVVSASAPGSRTGGGGGPRRLHSPSGHVGRYQDLSPAALELVQRAQPRTLTQLSVQGDRGEAE